MIDDEQIQEMEEKFRAHKPASAAPRRQRKRSHAQVMAELEQSASSKAEWSGVLYPSPKNIPDEIKKQASGTRQAFNPTFHASRYEREWILNYLGPFYEEHLITDVLRQVKGGKEATVYCCRAHKSTGVKYIAAKVYRPQMFRALKNDAQYRRGREFVDTEGKQVRGRREKLAMKKKSEFGHELLHTTWLTNEYRHLRALHAAGVDVPRPFAQSDNAILMEYLGSENFPAPTLNSVRLKTNEARAVFARLMQNVELMLAHKTIHADLSAFNVLYWRGEIKIIDLPQAVDPFVNPDARLLFTRDITRLCQYFSRYGIQERAEEIAGRMWEKYVKE